ncbi:LysR family transcriptional regulator [Eggerthella sinensis]|uniref:LysR family transcriptional regulator n=1 Tax=Eggerthella sinensis TaxID=242230 RepID=UPI0022DEAFAE|nr:LysR family transcriptional regulator [Eggerthella sinensis]
MLQDKCDYFMLAYDSPSFSAAANKVPMSPQGFAKAIRNLERELGVPLFAVDEDGTRRATPYADELYEYAKRMRAERNLLASAFERISSSGYVELRIACSLGVPGLLGSGFLDGFLEAHPDVSITLNEMPDALCESVLRDGLYDLALTVSSTADDFVSHELYASPVLYWVRADDPLAERDVLELGDLAQRRLAIPGDDFKCYRDLLARFEREGVEPPAIVKYSEIFWIYEFVLRGEGIGFTLPHLASLEVFNGSDAVVALPTRDFRWGFGVSYLKAHTPGPREEDLIAYLEQRAARRMRTRA